MASVEWDGFDNTFRILTAWESFEFVFVEPLLDSWSDIMVEDRRICTIEGKDKDGQALTPTKYRKSTTKPARSRPKNRGFGELAGRLDFGGFGPFSVGLNNNLSTEEYEQLTGPPLAPRGLGSRIWTNYNVRQSQLDDVTFAVDGEWHDVVDEDGREFLPDHFLGLGVPVRDLRGVSPAGMEKVNRATIAFVELRLN
jgi:hypothetical protein